jgi:hypothetical protein
MENSDDPKVQTANERKYVILAMMVYSALNRFVGFLENEYDSQTPEEFLGKGLMIQVEQISDPIEQPGQREFLEASAKKAVQEYERDAEMIFGTPSETA